MDTDAVVSDTSTWRDEATNPHLLSRHLGIGDPDPGGKPAEIAARLALYKQAKIGILRVDFDWRGLEGAEGQWRDPAIANFLQMGARAGFMFKATVGAMPAPPRWFFERHPDAQLTNQDGLKSFNVVSYWWPGLKALLEEKDERLFNWLKAHDLLDRLANVIVPLGPASEGIYPAPWTTSEPGKPPKFWFYDPHAGADFARAMQGKYGAVETANRAWGTAFASWDEVRPPTPGAHPGALWADVLDWYRDAKRDFARWQMQHYARLIDAYYPQGRRPRLMLLVPGTHTSAQETAQAVRSGDGDDRVKLQLDSEFLLCLAHEAGADLQYTALPNAGEVRYLTDYMRAHDCAAPMWGENVGNAGAPEELDDEVRAFGLAGQEYIGANVFEADHMTPTAKYSGLISAHLHLLELDRARP